MLQCLLPKVKIAQKKHLIIANILTPGKQGINKLWLLGKCGFLKLKNM